MKKVKKADIGKLLGQWQQEYAVVVPTKEGETVGMAAWDGQDISFLDWYRNTVIPPKANFLPNIEKLFGFQKIDGCLNLEVPPADGKLLLFGIRPCDARALSIIDNVFQDTYEDNYYLNRRKNTVLVGLGCLNPYDSCFCTSLGFGPAEASDVDLMLTDLGDEMLIEEVTEKGKELLAKAQGLEEAAQGDEARAAGVKEAAAKKVTRTIDVDSISERFPAAFDNEKYWEKTAAKCVSCGVCTFLCPTCYCFDINDEKDARYRNWDCCSFPLYTKMPAENPREEKWRRVRQKVSHKYMFFPMLFNEIACTGCGRCIRLCPVNWDITQTLESACVAGTENENGD